MVVKTIEATQVAIEFRDITKKFGNFIANDKINLKIKKHSIHAIIGENGAGKSTLMNQLFGLLTPTDGLILIQGKKVNIANPNVASALGLSMVHQHFQLVENHTILENVILGNENVRGLWPINYQRAKYKLLEISKKYNLNINLNMLVKKASVGMQQRVEILKMLYRGADILIFDEPTSMLTPQEIDGLLQLFLDLKTQQKTIIFISHKLQEVKKVADFGTVIRKGQVVKNFHVRATSTTKMAEYMVGRKLVVVKNKHITTSQAKILEMTNLHVAHATNPRAWGLKGLSLSLNKGEILAIAGVEGNGQLELVNAIFGLQKLHRGTIKVSNDDGAMIVLKSKNVNQRYQVQMAFVPEDRYKYAMLQHQNLFINAILQLFKFKPFSIMGWLMNHPRNKLTKKIINEFDVRGAREGHASMSALSGGNQQKFIVGREMMRVPKILILFQPTRGLDIGALEFIHRKTLEAKAQGTAVLLISYELSEIMAMADRIAVLSEGKLINITRNKHVSREQIGKWMAGIK